jgi:hypothetical protein
MNAQRLTRVMLAGAVALALTALTVLLIALPATAGPTAQDGWTPIPTPTSPPVVDFDYVLTTVGGDDTPQVFPGQEVNGVTFGETTVEAEFPDRLTFRATISADREIDRVNVLLTYRNGVEQALAGRAGEESQAWTTTWTLGKQFPAWAEFEFRWCVADTAGETTCAESQPLTLVDPNQVWNRVENDYAILYWYGFGEDQREDIARRFTRAATVTHQRLIEGFGRDLSYKPVYVIYPDGESSQQWLSWGLGGGVYAGTVSLGITAMVLAPAQTPQTAEAFAGFFFADCPLLPSGEWPMEYRLRYSTEGVTTYQLSSEFQASILSRSVSADPFSWDNVNHGPWFWWYGQGRWFTNNSYWDWSYEERVQQVAAEYGIKPLQQMLYNDYVGPDACPGFLEDVGASFINWLVYTYGIETHRRIVELMIPTEDVPRGMPFEDAIQEATGKPFDELENEWRAYLELPPLE